MSIAEDLQASIRKNLPAEVGEALRQRLAEAEENERKLEQLRGQITELNKNNNFLNGKYREHQETIKELRGQVKDAKDLERERLQFEFEKKVSALEVAHAQERVKDHREVMSLVFRNAEIRRRVLEIGAVPVAETEHVHQMNPQTGSYESVPTTVVQTHETKSDTTTIEEQV